MSPRSTRPSVEKVRRWIVAAPAPEAEPAADPPPPRRTNRGIYDDPTPVLHGYTVTDISSLVGVVVLNYARRGSRDLDEKRAVATLAVVEELHRHESDPGASALLRAAEYAVQFETRSAMSDRGYNTNPWKYDREYQVGFPAYWIPGAVTALEDKVVERMATTQVMATLSERQKQTLQTLAECGGDPKAAAALLGIRPNSVSGNLLNARAAFLALWFEHETPPTINFRKGRKVVYSAEAAAARPEIARRAVRIREERYAAAREVAA